MSLPLNLITHKSPMIKSKQAVSTGVRPTSTRTSIVSQEDDIGLAAMDHDFHYGSIVPSVLLSCNIPSDIGGSFFCGDEETGTGQIFVTLRDAIFDPSKVFDHMAQMINTFGIANKNPSVLVLQTDGGPDRSLKRVQVRLALVATFKYLNLNQMCSQWLSI